MSLMHQIRPVASKKAGERLVAAAKEMRASVKAEPVKTGPKRGPKPSGNAKTLLTLRLKPETIAKFKATGPGWQSRMSDALDAAAP